MYSYITIHTYTYLYMHIRLFIYSNALPTKIILICVKVYNNSKNIYSVIPQV